MRSNNNSCAIPCCDYGRSFSGICDFHSHILPAMDDGAYDAEVSISMLSLAKKQGIGAMVATSHFYPDRESPESFLARREESVKALVSAGYLTDKAYPTVYVGAEVAFFAGIGASSQLDRLCIEGTRCVLVEMPFEKWTDSVINEVISIKTALGLKPIIAHVERYISYQKRNSLARLIEGGALIQSNAEYFTEKKTQKKALKLMLQGGIHLLGSDAHGLVERTPNLGSGIEIIGGHKFGKEMLEDVESCSRYVLKGAIPITKLCAAETV